MKFKIVLLILFALTACEKNDNKKPDPQPTPSPNTPAPNEDPVTLQGTITGDSIDGVQVLLTGASQQQTQSDAEGNFRFADIPPGQYTLSVEKKYFQATPSAIQIDTESDDLSMLSFRMDPLYFSVAGQVSGPFPAGTRIRIVETGDESAVDSEGRYTFSTVAAGAYNLTAIAENFTFEPPQHSIDLTENLNTINFTAISQSIYSISGNVLFELPDVVRNNLPLNLITVELSGEQQAETQINPVTGAFIFDNLPNGLYQLQARIDGYYAEFSPQTLEVEILSDNAVNQDITMSPGYNYVFVASTTLSPSDNFTAIADTLCQNLADQQAYPGNYLAWVSTASVNAKDRFDTAQGWVRTDHRPFVNTLPDLLDGLDAYPLNRNESVQRLAANTRVMTATAADGTYMSTASCSNWSDFQQRVGIGLPNGGSDIWTAYGVGSCVQSYHLYCFGVSRQKALTIKPTEGRYAFITQSTHSGRIEKDALTGIPAADAICNAEAESAGLKQLASDNYKALLASNDAAPLSRFNTDGPTWVRPDGIPIVDRPEDLSNNRLEVPVLMQANGDLVAPLTNAWLGSHDLNSPGLLEEDTCTNWTNAASDTNRGKNTIAGSTDIENRTTLCNTTNARFICMQE